MLILKFKDEKLHLLSLMLYISLSCMDSFPFSREEFSVNTEK